MPLSLASSPTRSCDACAVTQPWLNKPGSAREGHVTAYADCVERTEGVAGRPAGWPQPRSAHPTVGASRSKRDTGSWRW